MGSIALDCPHCLHENSSFQSVGGYMMEVEKKEGRRVYVISFKCGGCEKGVMANIFAGTNQSPHDYPADIEALDAYEVLEIYPKKVPIDAPEHLSTTIAALYLQAAGNLKPGMWDSAAMMGRRVLEVALKELKPDLKGTLYNRIDKLADEYIITPDMKKWAHAIRLDGNDASHDGELIEDTKAKELMYFVEVFLMYTFTLPGMLKARYTKNEDAGD